MKRVPDSELDFSDLSALFINTTLTRSPGVSHTQLLVDASAAIMAKHRVRVDQFRAVDYPIATGIYPDMREHGWATDAWPELFERVLSIGHPRHRWPNLARRQQQRDEEGH